MPRPESSFGVLLLMCDSLLKTVFQWWSNVEQFRLFSLADFELLSSATRPTVVEAVCVRTKPRVDFCVRLPPFGIGL